MIRTKCPRCGSHSLENYETFSTCLECNFNTEEGFAYEQRHSAYEKAMTKIAKLKTELNKLVKEINEEFNQIAFNY